MESAARLLLRVAQLVTEASAQDQVCALLPEAAVELAGADAAAVLRVAQDGRVHVAASTRLPAATAAWSAEAEAVDAALGEELRRAAGERFARSRVLAMMAGGDLFGALVLLYASPDAGADEARLDVTRGLADLAAAALARAAQMEELRTAYSDLRASQDALMRTEKLRALGQMSAGITHDLKNMLNPLSLHLQLAKRSLAKGDVASVEAGIGEALGVVRRGVETVERLRDFSRQAPETTPEAVDVDRIVREAVDIAKPRMAARGGRLNTIELELGAPPRVLARAGELVSAIVNLVVNAIDAMPGGGAITLRTRAERGGVAIEVADAGPGMPEDVRRRAFEPFFTTKGEAGTGLGLAMVYACMQRHGGSVVLDSEVGRGTTFHLWLPAAPAA